MQQRGITPADVLTVLARPSRGAEPGNRGTLVVEGYPRGRRLQVVVTSDRRLVATAMWKGQVVVITHTLDPEVGALYLRIDDSPVDTTVEVSPTVFVDLDRDGRSVGLEVLDAREGSHLLDRPDVAAAIERFGLPHEARQALQRAVIA